LLITYDADEVLFRGRKTECRCCANDMDSSVIVRHAICSQTS
jgi:hypothetical protein